MDALPENGPTVAARIFVSGTFVIYYENTPTQFLWDPGTVVTLYPVQETYNGRPFARWLRNGEPYTSELSVEITMNDDETWTAEYGAGAVTVSIKPKRARKNGARWRLDGGSWLKHKQVLTSVPVGEHVLEFKDIDGWISPPEEVIAVEDGMFHSFSRQYVRK